MFLPLFLALFAVAVAQPLLLLQQQFLTPLKATRSKLSDLPRGNI